MVRGVQYMANFLFLLLYLRLFDICVDILWKYISFRYTNSLYTFMYICVVCILHTLQTYALIAMFCCRSSVESTWLNTCANTSFHMTRTYLFVAFWHVRKHVVWKSTRIHPLFRVQQVRWQCGQSSFIALALDRIILLSRGFCSRIESLPH